MDGQRNGMPILVFDAIYGSKGGQPFTVIVCQTERNPFQAASTRDRVIQSHRCTALYGVEFFGFSWTMSTKRLNDHLSNLQPEE
jgi:hypothetical protein